MIILLTKVGMLFYGFKDFNQNTNTEIQLLEKNPWLKGYIDIVNRNSYSLWSKKQYNWAEWTRPRNTLNKEFLETKANEARTSMITRNITVPHDVKNTIMSFTRKGGRRGKKN